MIGMSGKHRDTVSLRAVRWALMAILLNLLALAFFQAWMHWELAAVEKPQAAPYPSGR